MAGPPLEISELATLLVRMERGVEETAAGFQRGMTMVALLFFGMALLYGASFQAWGMVDAIRDAPERVVSIRHYQTSDSRRFFVSDWLEIKTADHRLVVKVQGRWQALLDLATRRCPGAKIL